MSKRRIPISAAKNIAKEHGQQQVILVTWDGEKTHVVTYGETTEACAQAASGGNLVKRALGWPESMCDEQPSRVKKLEARIEELERELRIAKMPSEEFLFGSKGMTFYDDDDTQ